MGLFRPLFFLLTVVTIAHTFFIPDPQGVTVIRSKYNNDVTISYKQTSICETSARAYAGYVSLPPNSLADLGVNQTYPINLFFWFFEARNNPSSAPLSIWIDGGPGDATIGDAIDYNGPCFVQPDSNSTTSNQWTFNDYVNMLYIDQPVQAGFSYDTLHDVISDLYTLEDFPLNGTSSPKTNTTFQPATHASGNMLDTTSTSQAGAYAMFHFAQAWFQEFPEYKAQSISLTAFSYGGRYAPAIFDVFEQQNERIANGTWGVQGEQDILPLNALILQSGCVDFEDTFTSMPDYAAHNTYGVQGENGTLEMQYAALPGCLNRMYKCGNLTLLYDPQNTGFNSSVNKVCKAAQDFCQHNVQEPFEYNVTASDIAAPVGIPYPPAFALAYLQRPHVQADLGVRTNYTVFSRAISYATYYSGDLVRPGWRDKLANLLDKGVKVAMMHGDRDYSCNWFGGETTSLNIPHEHQAQFRAAGYEPIHTNDSYIGGFVRQYGNLSFSRVFEAGHSGIRQQPETFYEIFNRAIYGLDISTGNVPVYQDGQAYSSYGPASVKDVKNQLTPIEHTAVCYLYNMGSSCTEDQRLSIYNHSGILKDFMLVDQNSTQLYPEIVGSG